MKKCFLFLASVLFALSTYAANDSFNIVTIHLQRSKMDIVITKKVKIHFTDTHLVVEGTDSEVSIERSKFTKFTHSYDENAGVNDIADGKGVDFQGDKIVFYGLPANTPVAVYSLAGVEVMSAVAEGDYELSLAGLSSGVYVVNANGNSFKVTVK